VQKGLCGEGPGKPEAGAEPRKTIAPRGGPACAPQRACCLWRPVALHARRVTATAFRPVRHEWQRLPHAYDCEATPAPCGCRVSVPLSGGPSDKTGHVQHAPLPNQKDPMYGKISDAGLCAGTHSQIAYTNCEIKCSRMPFHLCNTAKRCARVAGFPF